MWGLGLVLSVVLSFRTMTAAGRYRKHPCLPAWHLSSVRTGNVLQSHILRGGLACYSPGEKSAERCFPTPCSCFSVRSGKQDLGWPEVCVQTPLSSLHWGSCWTEGNWILLSPTSELPILKVPPNHRYFKFLKAAFDFSYKYLIVWEKFVSKSLIFKAHSAFRKVLISSPKK